MATLRQAPSTIDRTTVELRLGDGWGIRAIARAHGRLPGTIWDEVSRHCDASDYLVQRVQWQATVGRRLSGPKSGDHNGSVFDAVAGRLRLGWSPEQISGRRIEDGMEQQSGAQISHERSTLRSRRCYPANWGGEVIACVRHDKPKRGRKPHDIERRGKLCDMTKVTEWPEKIEDSLVPGHWEDDLTLGAGRCSAIGTLVERTTRLVPVRMPTRKADIAACEFAGALNAIPAPLRNTLTYDPGKEMTDHSSLAQDTGMRIFFADP